MDIKSFAVMTGTVVEIADRRLVLKGTDLSREFLMAEGGEEERVLAVGDYVTIWYSDSPVKVGDVTLYSYALESIAKITKRQNSVRQTEHSPRADRRSDRQHSTA